MVSARRGSQRDSRPGPGTWRRADFECGAAAADRSPRQQPGLWEISGTPARRRRLVNVWPMSLRWRGSSTGRRHARRGLKTPEATARSNIAAAGRASGTARFRSSPRAHFESARKASSDGLPFNYVLQARPGGRLRDNGIVRPAPLRPRLTIWAYEWVCAGFGTLSSQSGSDARSLGPPVLGQAALLFARSAVLSAPAVLLSDHQGCYFRRDRCGGVGDRAPLPGLGRTGLRRLPLIVAGDGVAVARQRRSSGGSPSFGQHASGSSCPRFRCSWSCPCCAVELGSGRAWRCRRRDAGALRAMVLGGARIGIKL